MPSEHGAIETLIWSDDNFLALTPEAQRAYFMLISQPNISVYGVLPATLRRWSTYAPDSTPEGLSKTLVELASKRFITYDEEMEEIWVPNFAKWKREAALQRTLSDACGGGE